MTTKRGRFNGLETYPLLNTPQIDFQSRLGDARRFAREETYPLGMKKRLEAHLCLRVGRMKRLAIRTR